MASGHTGNVAENLEKHCQNDIRAENAQRVGPARLAFEAAADSELARVVFAWPNLPPAIRAPMMALLNVAQAYGS